MNIDEPIVPEVISAGRGYAIYADSDLHKEPELTLSGGKFYVTSVNMAHAFHKKHVEVLKTIRSFIRKLPSRIMEEWVIEASYVAKNGTLRPIYFLSPEGVLPVLFIFTHPEDIPITHRYLELLWPYLNGHSEDITNGK